MIRQHRGLVLLVLLSLVLRILVVFWASGFREHPDVLRYKDWARVGYHYGFADSYKPQHMDFGMDANDQPPGSLYVVTGMYWVWIQIGKVLSHLGVAPGSSPWVNIILLHMLLRVPSVLCDGGIGIVIYLIVRKFGRKEKDALLGASLFLLNPIVIYNSSFWGQMDAVNNFPAIIALFFLIGNHVILACAFLTASLLVKFSVSYELPLFLIAAIRRSRSKIYTGVLIAVITACIIWLVIRPVFPQPYTWYINFLSMHATGQMTNVTAFAFNFWWMVFRPTLMMGSSNDLTKVVDIWLHNSPLTETRYGIVSLGYITIAVALFFILPMYLWYAIRSVVPSLDRRKVTVAAYAIIAMLAFLLLPQMHERYLYPSIAPLTVLIGIGFPIVGEYILLSLLNLMNLIIVWHPMPLPQWVFDVMKNSSLQWSISMLTVMTIFWTIRKVLKYTA